MIDDMSNRKTNSNPPKKVGGTEDRPRGQPWKVALSRHSAHTRDLQKAHHQRAAGKELAEVTASAAAHEHEAAARHVAALEKIAAECAEPHTVASIALGRTATRGELEASNQELKEANSLFLEMLVAIRTGVLDVSDIPRFESDNDGQ